MNASVMIGAVAAALVASLAGFATFSAMLPTFFDLWHLTGSEAGWVNGLYYGGYMAAVPVLVSLTDRIDARRIFMIGAVIATAGALGFAWHAEGFWSASFWRFVSGVGLAGTYMTGLRALTDRLPEASRTRAVAFYTASFSIGTGASFWLTGSFEAMGGWQVGALAAAAGPPLAFLIMAFCLKPRPAPPRRPLRQVLDARPVLSNRPAMSFILAYAAHCFELMSYRAWLVAYLAFAASLAAAPGWLDVTALATFVVMLGLPASILGNELARKYGRRRVAIGIMLGSALLAPVFGFAAGLPFLLVATIATIYGIFVTGESATLTAGAVVAARKGEQGVTMAMHSFIGFGFAMIGPLISGVMLDLGGGKQSTLGWGLCFATLALGVALGPLVLWLLGRRADD
ncbi:MFS transporter [Oceanibacterium hippocampi]|uniref:Major Facilitator Superfamily protein n=1 Tax=Oceanibacterium hippocampi TaxID=745714 RepID=A0A1Y5RCB7_9PROT|nr:MFS transporter [Oceanibacterium hippocampi]SLN13790.1 Major Facilitator Superfamily protein [Oceanibacterium hippocampi]